MDRRYYGDVAGLTAAAFTALLGATLHRRARERPLEGRVDTSNRQLRSPTPAP